ncbi:MAG: hypothetical protein HZB33_04750 [Nitrospirae bacterium]|nr:hypothetical protein [Nitrospirota bacterium]
MNSPPLILRILLLALLPVIAAVLYARGQHFDPALIDFKTVSEKPAETQPAGPPLEAAATDKPGTDIKKVAGFRQVGREQRYVKDNLYEHVNGHAEYFIGAGFLSLTVTDYVKEDSKSVEPEFQAEVFDMGNAIQAFGVLADESGDNPQPASVGAMGYKNSGGINFIKGRFYVKTTVFDRKISALNFAKAIDGSLPGGRDSLAIFSRLPDLGKVEKTRFIREGYRGLDFLSNVVEREYTAGGRKVTVAMMGGKGQDMTSLKALFFDYFRKSAMRYEKAERQGQEFYRIMDKYEGNWFMIPGREAIFGVFGTEDETVVDYFFKGKRRG